LLLTFPLAQLAAQTNNPMLYPKGEVSINGKKTARATAVFSGDVVKTGADSSASLAALGSTMLVSPNSVFTYRSNAVDVDCGGMLVTTVVKRMAAKVANLSITPASDVAKYEITRSAETLEIASREGSIGISDGTQTTVLDPGKVIRFKSPGECSPVMTAGPNSATSGSVSVGKGKIAGLLLGGGAAAGIAVALSHRGSADKQSVSPAAP
jgi:hypothetical protein